MTVSALFLDLAVLMAVAGLAAVIFARRGWPKAIGYILAGIVMGSSTWGGNFLKVLDQDSVGLIGQIGVVFLMFGMGLSFSAKDLKRIQGVAVPSAIIDTVVMIGLGYFVGKHCFGWDDVPSIFLGVAICDSATTLLAKVIDEMGWSNRPFSKYVLGTSVCEDIICVGAIAVATGFSNGEGMSLAALGKSLGGLLAFFLSVIVLGFVLVPRLLKSVAKRKDDESLLLAILGCCFGVSWFAESLRFSLALGAFLVGILGSVSCVRERLVSLVDPLKSMFSAIFFVSIGLLVNLPDLWAYLPKILIVSSVVVGGKMVNNFVGSLLCGVDVKTSVQNAFGLAQIGEFAFMTAISYGILRKAVVAAAVAAGKPIPADPASGFFTIAIGASLLTTLLNPFMIRLSDPVGDWAERRFPSRLRKVLETWRAWLEKIKSQKGSPASEKLWWSAIRFAVYAVLAFAGAFVCSKLAGLNYEAFSGWFEKQRTVKELVFCLLSNVFFLAILPLASMESHTMSDMVAEMLAGRSQSRVTVAFRQTISRCAYLALVLLFIIIWMSSGFVSLPHGMWGVLIYVVLLLCAMCIVGRLLKKKFETAKKRFNEALTEEERREGLAQTTAVALPQGDDFHRFVLTANSPAVGGTVVSLNIRAKTGASIVAVVRGGQVFRNVGPDIEFRIGDELVALGDAHQTGALKDLLGVTA